MNRLFARAKVDGAHAVVQEAGAFVSWANLDRTINRISAAITDKFGRALTVPIKKVWAFRDLPHAILTNAVAQGIQATAAHVADDEAAHIEKAVLHQATFGLTLAKTLDLDIP